MRCLETGQVIDDLYEIVEPIGKGGSAWVYAARQTDGREVAIKVLDIDKYDATGIRQRFFQELLSGSRVRHRNIVEVLDFGALAGTGHPYLVMERLQGRTLNATLRDRGPIPEERVARLFRGALEALAEAHAHGVVHQDLKPTNLFVRANADGSEDLVLLDFGIAKVLRDGAMSATDWTATPRYAAPEYILRGEVQPGIDVYQMGLVLAESLSGRPVVPSTIAKECLDIHAKGQLTLGPEVTGSRLYGVIVRALQKDPDDRYGDAQELLEAVIDAASRSPIASRFVLLDDDDAPTEPSMPSEVSVHALAHRAPPALAAPRRRSPMLLALALGLAVILSFLSFLAGLWARGLLETP